MAVAGPGGLGRGVHHEIQPVDAGRVHHHQHIEGVCGQPPPLPDDRDGPGGLDLPEHRLGERGVLEGGHPLHIVGQGAGHRDPHRAGRHPTGPPGGRLFGTRHRGRRHPVERPRHQGAADLVGPRVHHHRPAGKQRPGPVPQPALLQAPGGVSGGVVGGDEQGAQHPLRGQVQGPQIDEVVAQPPVLEIEPDLGGHRLLQGLQFTGPFPVEGVLEAPVQQGSEPVKPAPVPAPVLRLLAGVIGVARPGHQAHRLQRRRRVRRHHLGEHRQPPQAGLNGILADPRRDEPAVNQGVEVHPDAPRAPVGLGAQPPAQSLDVAGPASAGQQPRRGQREVDAGQGRHIARQGGVDGPLVQGQQRDAGVHDVSPPRRGAAATIRATMRSGAVTAEPTTTA